MGGAADKRYLLFAICLEPKKMSANLRSAKAFVALMVLTSGCAVLSDSDEYDQMRATEEMAPANPKRGTRTIRVTTRRPAELDVRLLTFYSQFHPPARGSTRSAPRSGKLADGCWRSEFAVLQYARSYYTRTFAYPVVTGIQTQDLVLDEVLPGTCHFGLTGIGYEVRLKASSNGENVTRYRMHFDVAVEEGGASAAEVVLRCGVRTSKDAKQPFLRCERDMQPGFPPLGPLNPVGATLNLDFVFKGGVAPL